MIRLGLLGHPVAHSRSPALHAAAAASTGLDVRYDLFDVSPLGLPAWLAADHGLVGFNVTAPHKEAVGRWVQRLGPAARRLGVVNTVGCGAAPIGWNTDLYGFRQALGEPPDGPAVVLGAGGAARAVIAGLADAGVTAITVAARSVEQARAALDRLGITGRAVTFAPGVVADAALVIDAVGGAGRAAVAGLPFARARASCRVMCLAYGAGAAPVIAAAARAGCRAEDGLAMLAWQGVAAFERWTGRRADPAAVLGALRAV